MDNTKMRKGCSDSAVDAVAAVVLITIIIASAIFWLTRL